MQRIPSGVTDQYIYFFAVDSTDKTTPETGLNTWTVYRSRNGGASAAMTSPTINETDTTNMPGWYELLMDEDTTLDAGDNCQVMALHITHAGMDPAKVLVEIYRPVVSAGETITVSSGAVSSVTTTTTATNVTTVNGLAANTVTASALATDAVTEIQSGLATSAALTTVEGKIDTIDTNVDAILVDTGTDIPASIDALPTAAENADAVWDEALAGHLTAGSTGEALDAAGSVSPPTAAEIADAVWDEDATGHQTQGTFGQAIGDPGADTDTIFGLVNTNLDAAVSTRASQTSVDTIDDFLDTEVAAVLADTNELQTDWADGGRLDLILDARASQASVDTIDTNVDAILVDTGTTLDGKIDTIDTTLDALVADVGANGVGLTAIPWNSSWDAEVESEVTDALTAYGSPTTATVVNANIVQVNEIPVDGSGTEADPWRP